MNNRESPKELAEMEQLPETNQNHRAQSRILIVDDEETALKRMKGLMDKQGYEVHTASTGTQALDLLKSFTFDLVLTDLILDSIDGLNVLANAKAASPDTEVIIITGYASVDSAIEATRKGAFHYLQKPIRPRNCIISWVRPWKNAFSRCGSMNWNRKDLPV